MSLVSLAKTFFSTGPDDQLAVVDVYTKSDSSPVNGIQDNMGDIPFDQGLDAILKGQNEPKSILDSIKQSDLFKKLSIDSTIGRMCGGKVSLKSLCQDLSTIGRSGLSLENKLKNLVSFDIGGNVSKIVATGLSDARAISGLVNDFTNNGFKGVFKDFGATSGLITSLSRQASSIGLSGVFKSLSASVTDKNILMCSAGDLLPDAVSRGDAGLFSEIANSSIGKQVRSIFPNIVGSLIKGIKLPDGLQQQNYAGHFDDLSKAFKIVDNGWNKYSRGGSVSNILSGYKLNAGSAFMNLLKSKVFSKSAVPTPSTAVSQVGFVGPYDPITADINTLAAHDENDNKFLLMMSKFKEKKVGDELKEMLPSIKLTPDPVHENLEVTIT